MGTIYRLKGRYGFDLPVFTEIIFWGISSMIQDKKKIAAALIVFGCLGYLDSLFMPVRLPWSMDVALTGTVFYGAGFILKDEINNLFKATFSRLPYAGLYCYNPRHLLLYNGRVDMKRPKL